MIIIEIDITNACEHSCSNCTRMCGNHKKPFFMSFDTFKRAVDSLDEFPNTVGMIGGEPTMHPEFERFADYMRKKRVPAGVKLAREPIVNMQGYQYKFTGEWTGRNAVLLSSLNNNYYKHFETINDTFTRQLLNDHNNACMHQALLMSRKELDIPDEEWVKKRDACWVQNTWSATITPKGAFFCEVAGALDMLFDGPGGWPIEPGWWRRRPEDFGEQLSWCEICGGCLDVPKRLSSEERDDVTPGLFERLKTIGSPKALQGRCVVHDPMNYDKFKDPTFTGTNDYMAAGGNIRTTPDNRNLYPRSALICPPPEDWREKMKKSAPPDWVAVTDGKETKELENLLSNCILNPGCVYYREGKYVLFNVQARSLRSIARWPQLLPEDIREAYPEDKRIEITDELWGRLVKYLKQIGGKGSRIKLI
ncbi:radical SAM protein [Selenomonas ruminantium]|nr:radical SAM protein [Selenomonas ruminantium]